MVSHIQLLSRKNAYKCAIIRMKVTKEEPVHQIFPYLIYAT